MDSLQQILDFLFQDLREDFKGEQMLKKYYHAAGKWAMYNIIRSGVIRTGTLGAIYFCEMKKWT